MVILRAIRVPMREELLDREEFDSLQCAQKGKGSGEEL